MCEYATKKLSLSFDKNRSETGGISQIASSNFKIDFPPPPTSAAQSNKRTKVGNFKDKSRLNDILAIKIALQTIATSEKEKDRLGEENNGVVTVVGKE